jgi:hypothetical protein
MQTITFKGMEPHFAQKAPVALHPRTPNAKFGCASSGDTVQFRGQAPKFANAAHIPQFKGSRLNCLA